jgi:hypothetical protein
MGAKGNYIYNQLLCHSSVDEVDVKRKELKDRRYCASQTVR